MEMAGKHSDHYFCRWQAKIVTTIKKKLKKWKKRKVLRIAWFGEKVDQKNSHNFLPPPRHVCRKISASVDGGPSGGSRVSREFKSNYIGLHSVRMGVSGLWYMVGGIWDLVLKIGVVSILDFGLKRMGRMWGSRRIGNNLGFGGCGIRDMGGMMGCHRDKGCWNCFLGS